LDSVYGARAHMAQPIADADRMAVRHRACGAADPDAAARPGDVLNHHSLTERDRQMIGKYARDRVGDPAGRSQTHRGRDALIKLPPHRTKVEIAEPQVNHRRFFPTTLEPR
jgi:hypothetical protein